VGIGQLRKRVYFSRLKVRVDDGGGGSPKEWVPALTVWGQLMPERGREILAAGRLESSAGAVLKIRATAAARAIDASYKATIDGVDHQLRSISNPDQRNRFLEIVLEVGVAI